MHFIITASRTDADLRRGTLAFSSAVSGHSLRVAETLPHGVTERPTSREGRNTRINHTCKSSGTISFKSLIYSEQIMEALITMQHSVNTL